MIKKYIAFSLFLAFILSGTSFATVQEDESAIIQQLMAQIEALTSQIQALQQQVQELQTQQQTLQEEINALTRQLEQGMQGDDVKLLQQMLATDPEIYPEGLVTGYFGPLTKAAVQRFQEKAGIDRVGRIGPQTLARINQIFEEGIKGRGAGLVEIKEGVFVPPGLLKAPGIIRLMGPAHPLFQSLPDNDENGENGDGNNENGINEENYIEGEEE